MFMNFNIGTLFRDYFRLILIMATLSLKCGLWHLNIIFHTYDLLIVRFNT